MSHEVYPEWIQERLDKIRATEASPTKAEIKVLFAVQLGMTEARILRRLAQDHEQLRQTLMRIEQKIDRVISFYEAT